MPGSCPEYPKLQPYKYLDILEYRAFTFDGVWDLSFKNAQPVPITKRYRFNGAKPWTDLGEIGSDTLKLKDLKQQSVGGGRGTGGVKTYTVNVKSAGPDREFNTFDDIWSYPDEIN